MPGFPGYRAPDDGSPESADPGFSPRNRGCGLCGREFRTTAAFRYYCEACRGGVVRLRHTPKSRLRIRKGNPSGRPLD